MNSNFKNKDSALLLNAKLFVFLLCPFLSFLLSLLDPRKKSSYIIFFLFGMLFCWHMEPVHLDRYDDLSGIIDYFKENKFTSKDIAAQLYKYFTLDSDAPKEIYENILMWFTRLFSNNYHLYFLFASIPWLFFELSSLKKITGNSKFKISITGLIILGLFIAPRDIITLQNPRYTTAVWLSVFATICYFEKYNLKPLYVVLIILTPTIHSGYLFYVLPFLIFLLACKYSDDFWGKFFLISIPISFLNYDIFSSIDISLFPLPDNIRLWLEIYLSEDSYDMHIRNDFGMKVTPVVFMLKLLKNSTYLLMAYMLYRERNTLTKSDLERKFLNFFFFIYAVVNCIQMIPVLGNRAMWTIQILLVYMWFKFMYPRNKIMIYVLLLVCSRDMFLRYFHYGAVYSVVPLNIFYDNSLSLIIDSL